MLIEYIRDMDMNPVGCVVSTGRGKVGWSLCNPKDSFSKKRATEIAATRAEIVREEDLAFSLAVASMSNEKQRMKAKRLLPEEKEWLVDAWLSKPKYFSLKVRQLIPMISEMLERSKRYYKEN